MSSQIEQVEKIEQEENLELMIENDALGVKVMALSDELKSAAGDLKIRLNKGLPLEKAKLYRKNMQALLSANSVVERLWSETHSS